MHQLKIKRLLAAVSLALMPLVIVPQVSYAAGLGKLRVNSGLGEPLSAEIDVLSASNAELDSLEAKIASDTVYESQGIERPSLYNAIRIEVKKKASGAVLKLSSSEAITEPFLDMLIQMDWGSGQLLREYNLLLDPPGYSKPKNVEAPTVNAGKDDSVLDKQSDTEAATSGESKGKVKKAIKKAPKKTIESKALNEKPATSPAPQTTDQADSAVKSSDGYTTKSGDSLSNIAKKSLQDGVNLDQYMAAMFRANQGAFVRQNMNRLKVGQIVKMPSIEEAKAIAPNLARKEIVLHSKDWNNYKNSLADQVTHTSGQDNGEQAANQSVGKIATKAEDKPNLPTGPRDVVKLSKNDTKAGSAAQTQIAALQDELTARDNAIKEANTRSAMLEKRISDMEKLLTLKNQGLAEVQKNAASTQAPVQPAEANKDAESKPVADAKPPVGAVKPTEPAKTDETPKSEAEYTAVVTPPPQSRAAETDKVKAESQAPSIFDGLTEGLLADPKVLGAAAGGLALLGGVWLFVRNKRKRGLENLEKAIQTTSGLKENTVFGNTEGASIGSGTTSFLTDFSQSGGGMIDTHDVDPIAEAEVYMAYGRDAQAEEILKDAIAKDPKRAELHLKLLELYAGRKDTQAFETVAGELYSTVGTDDPLWAKAAMLGRGLEPNNPLYQSDGTDNIAVDAEINPFADTSMQPDEIHYSVDSGLSEDAIHTDTLDINSMDADFAAIDGADHVVNESNELEFSLDDKNVDDLVTLSSESESSTNAEDEMLALNRDLDFQTVDQQEELDQKELSHTVIDELAAEDEFNTPTTSLESEPVISDINEIDFSDFTGLEMPEVDEKILAQSEYLLPESSLENDQLASLATKTQDKLEEIDLDMPDVHASSKVEVEELASELTVHSETEEVAPTLDLPSFDLSGLNSSDISIASPVLDDSLMSSTTSLNEPSPEVDFSKIDLDLGVESASTGPTTELNSLADEFDMEAESSEVETKLDLVTAYIDMGDQEGAKELLDEVLKEGGPQQRIRAQDMLKSLA